MAERADGTLDLERDEEQERDRSRADVAPRERPAYAREVRSPDAVAPNEKMTARSRNVLVGR
jgi:hypothetical protein